MNLNFDISLEGLIELIESYYNHSMIYYRKSVYNKTSQGKRYMGHSLEELQTRNFQMSRPHGITDSINYCWHEVWEYI